MKHILLRLLVFLLVLVLVGCDHNVKQEKAAFDNQMKIVEQQEKAYYDGLEEVDLSQLKMINRTDATEDNKALIKNKKAAIKHILQPKFKAYQKAAKQLPTTNRELVALKTAYLEAIEKKGKSLEETECYVTLCLQLIESNESILSYTQQFDAQRAKVETLIKASTTSQNGENESYLLEQYLIDQHTQIKTVAEAVLEENDEMKQSKKINQDVIPRIEQSIKSLNQLHIDDPFVNKARQHAIQMYYELDSFYKMRAKSVAYSQRLSKMNIKQIIKTPDELENYEKKYNDKNDEIESHLH
ncbi:EMYY motif lipoprotein [Staphylococcus hyicus]|uniref:EMYY motif lipoprotein n=1 Tax=Staphylococcus hyicus TaxID=1284 RepID=A0ACD5FK18_STAHY|nr:EMYY motif lipoprotein [Staphylococcus hyicus]MDP4463115.1 EMYY motif lipoprotein [Staphylococcus hyicus]